MTETNEVISAFLDNEPFDANELTEALAEPSGRALLIDLIALRHLIGEDTMTPAGPARVRRPWMGLLVAAALLLALFGGYRAGERRGAAAAEIPPAPTLIVPATGNWQ